MQRGRSVAVGCVFVGAVVAAPFLALLYGIEAGLGVMVAALATTTVFGISAMREAEPEVRRRALPLTVVTGVFALVCLAVLIGRVV